MSHLSFEVAHVFFGKSCKSILAACNYIEIPQIFAEFRRLSLFLQDMFRLLRPICLLLPCVLAVCNVVAHNNVVLDEHFEHMHIKPALLRDPAHFMRFDSIITGKVHDSFTASSTPYLTFGSDPADWWLHFAIDNTMPHARNLVLRLNRKNFDAFHLWVLEPSGVVRDLGEVGASLHNDPRFLLTDGYYFNIKLQPGNSRFWVRACNRIGSMHLSMSLHTPEDYNQLMLRNVLVFGLFLGVMLVSLVFSLLLYIQNRNVIYLLYSAYVFNILLRETYNYSADFGFAPVFQRNVTSLLIALSFGMFFRKFLDLKSNLPRIDMLVKIYMWIIGVSGGVIWVLAKFEKGEVLKHIFTILDGSNLFFTLMALVIALYLFPKNPWARLTTFAYLPIALGFIAILLRNMNAIPNFPIINHAVMAGFIIQVLIFTIGFARWHRYMESERDVLQYKLAIEKSEKQLAVQKAEQRVKDSIARDLHDDVAASMSGIRILSQVAYKQFAHKVPEAAPLLEQITRSAQSTLESIGDLIWAVKPSPDYLNDLADRMREYASNVLDAQNIDYEIHIPRNLPVLKLNIETRRNLYLIFKEAINNAVKYSNCNSMDICLKINDNKLEMCVCDDGQGFPTEGFREGNGLPNMRQRAQDLGGAIQIIGGEKGVRVLFEMELPDDVKNIDADVSV